MDKRLENKLMMLRALISFLNQNADKWSGNGPLSQVIVELKNLINQIVATRKLVNTDQSGIVQQKSSIQEDLVDITFALASVLYAMAVRTGNQVLQQKVNMNRSDLVRLRDGELASTAQTVLDLLLEYMTSLTEYGITPYDATNLETKLNDYESSLPVNRVTVLERKTANKKIKELFTTANKLLTEQLDRMMTRFEKSEPDFYTSYRNARKVVAYGTRYEKPPVSEPTVQP